jgi:SAM-dependent methyltransferase
MDAMAQAGELPQFDVIAFHGIWSWVNAENRQHLVNIVDRLLKPGGAVYNSYNTLPGWSNFMPVRELMRLNGERLGEDRPIEDRVKETLAYTTALADAGAIFFKANPVAAMRLKGLVNMPLHYLAQEYFNRTWTPLYFADVAEVMNNIGCTFATAMNLLQMTGALVPPGTRKIIAGMPNRQFRETLRDFAVNQAFRCDLFVREPVWMNSREQEEFIANAKLVRLNPQTDTPLVLDTGYGKVNLDQNVSGTVLSALAEDGGSPKRIGDVFARPELSILGDKVRNEVVSVIIGKQWAAPVVDEVRPERVEACRKLNRALCEEATKGNTMCILASPVTGAGVPVSNEEMRFLFYRPEGEKPDITEWVRLVVDSHVRQGQALDFARAIEKLVPIADLFIKTRLPFFETMGVTF